LSAKDHRWFCALLAKTLKLQQNFLAKSERFARLLDGTTTSRLR
jgi:hypothetical protein